MALAYLPLVIVFLVYVFLETPSETNGLSQNFIRERFIDNMTFLVLTTILLYQYFRQLNKCYNVLRKNEVQLRAKTQQLQRSNEELERFAHVASHDLKSPLRNLVTFTNLLEF